MTYIDDEFHVTWFTPFIIGYWCYFKNQTKTKNYQLNKAQQPVPKLPISPLSLYQKLVINYHVIIRSYYSSLRASFFLLCQLNIFGEQCEKQGFPDVMLIPFVSPKATKFKLPNSAVTTLYHPGVKLIYKLCWNSATYTPRFYIFCTPFFDVLIELSSWLIPFFVSIFWNRSQQLIWLCAILYE